VERAEERIVTAGLYLNPRQAAEREPTAWENEFADVLESAFAAGVRELEPLIAELNATRVRPREGGDWTIARFMSTVAELGA
jgi:hypothetical protein